MGTLAGGRPSVAATDSTARCLSARNFSRSISLSAFGMAAATFPAGAIFPSAGDQREPVALSTLSIGLKNVVPLQVPLPPETMPWAWRPATTGTGVAEAFSRSSSVGWV